MEPTLREKIWKWADPTMFIALALWHFLVVALDSLLHRPADLLNGKARHKAFANMWVSVSPPANPNDSSNDPTEGALAKAPGLLKQASDVVLELGPGSGALMKHYDTTKIKSLYAVEPGTDLHPALRKSAAPVGFTEGKNFHILTCGAEVDSLVPTLQKTGVLGANTAPMFDTIVSIRSLCTLGKPREAIQCHYTLLKPGGRYIIMEHVANEWPSGKGSPIGKVMQFVYTALGWPFFIGCSLRSDTVGLMVNAAQVDGGWGNVDLKREQEWAVLPWAYGIFTKKEV